MRVKAVLTQHNAEDGEDEQLRHHVEDEETLEDDALQRRGIVSALPLPQRTKRKREEDREDSSEGRRENAGDSGEAAFVCFLPLVEERDVAAHHPEIGQDRDQRERDGI